MVDVNVDEYNELVRLFKEMQKEGLVDEYLVNEFIKELHIE